MKRRIKKCLCLLTAAAVMLGSMSVAQEPVWAKSKDNGQRAKANQAGARTAITVSTPDEFMRALRAGNSPITVQGLITISDGAESSGRMLPVKIPANTVIQGTEGSSINSRSPIQLQGNGVIFKNIEWVFSSSDELQSVPHREIFLAGYSLTLDNVKTYLKGGTIFDGSDEDLLPTVYGGGYPGTSVGTNASLTVRNSNDKTMFQAIYMGNTGHREGDGAAMTAYSGNAVLNLDDKATVKEKVDTSYNQRAEINMTGGENKYAKAKVFSGDENTTLTISRVSLEGTELNPTGSSPIGSIVLKDGASLKPANTTTSLQNVAVRSGACLDLTSAGNVTILGAFNGAEEAAEERGILVLNQNGGVVTINGTVTGTTQFQTGSKLFPSYVVMNKAYIYTQTGSSVKPNFVLAQKTIDDYACRLEYSNDNGAWTVYKGITAPTEGTTTSPTSSTTAPTQETTTSPTNSTTAPTQKPTTSTTRPTTAPTQKPTTSTTRPTTAPTQGTTTSPVKPTTGPTGGTTKPTTAPTTGNPVTPPTEPTVTPPTEKPEDHKHQYQSSVTKQATCTEEGIRTYTCACGHTYTESIAPSEHQYEEERIPATSKADGKVQKVCRVCSHITDVYVISRPRNPSWSKAEFTYDGKAKRPEVVIKDAKGDEMVPGADYEVYYPKTMKNPGIYTVVIEFCGDYRGKVTKTITIKPRETSLKKVVPGSRKLLLTWSRQTVQIDGYQVQYSRDKAFKGKTSKTATVKKTAAGTTVKKLKGKTKYYLRVRTYKTVKVSGKSKKLYSDWSGKKAVYTKR